MSIESILESVGYPTSTIVIDFECFFEVGVYHLRTKQKGGLTGPVYIADDRFEVTGVAWRCAEDGPTHLIEEHEFSEIIQEIDLVQHTVIGHHLHFDAMILAMRYGIQLPYTLDTLPIFRMLYPKHPASLGDLAKTLGLSASKGDTLQFSGLRRKDFSPEQWRNMRTYACLDADLTYEALEKMLPEIDVPTREIPEMDHTLKMYTNPTFLWDAAGAATLREQMSLETDKALEKVSWVQDV